MKGEEGRIKKGPAGGDKTRLARWCEGMGLLFELLHALGKEGIKVSDDLIEGLGGVI